MLLESIVITIIKKGFEEKPSYSLTVKGDGKIVYKGIENVKVKGVIESLLEDDKVISIMSGLKDSGFFSVDKDSFVFDESSNRSFTSIKVDMSDENNLNKSKIVSYYDDDSSVPISLKNFENKIDEILDSSRWIGKKDDITIKTKSSSKVDTGDIKKPRFNKKIVVGLISVFVVLLIIFFAVSSGFLNSIFKDSDKDDYNSGTAEYDSPVIPNLVIASSFFNGVPKESTIFKQGDRIYVVFDVENAVHNTSYDIVENLVVSHLGLPVYTYNKGIADNSSDSILERKITIDGNYSWVSGEYLVDVSIYDKISDMTVLSQTSFNMINFSGIVLPDVVINANSSYGYAPLSVNFNGFAYNFTGDVSFAWDFESDNVVDSYEENTKHVFSVNGTYIVTLTVTDELGVKVSETVSVEVFEQDTSQELKAEIVEIKPDEINTSTVVTFSSIAYGGSGGYLYEWDFNFDETFSSDGTGQIITHVFDTMGIYIIILKVTDSSDNSITATEVIWVDTP